MMMIMMMMMVMTNEPKVSGKYVLKCCLQIKEGE